jgi:hypothetical protein
MIPVKLYVGDWYREPKIQSYIFLLYPRWGVVAKSSMPYIAAAVTKYKYSGEDYIFVDNIADADYVVPPHPPGLFLKFNKEKFEKIITEARAAKKLILIEGSGDVEMPMDGDDLVLLRQSQYRYSARSNEMTVTLPADDLLQTYFENKLAVRKKSEIPSVGFAGWAQISLKQRLKTYIKFAPTFVQAIFRPEKFAEQKGVLLREKVLKKLFATQGIKTNFLGRTSYAGNPVTASGSMEKNRQEFVENLAGYDYALCVRGDGNSSIRFYEALSLGRIPLFLDTACVLPLEHVIDYRKFCVFVDHKDLNKIGEKLLEFHKNCSAAEFEQMQLHAREAYEKYLRPDVFPKHLAEELSVYAAKYYE